MDQTKMQKQIDENFFKLVHERLSPGKYWGGYKQICNLLEENIYGNKTVYKNRQLDRWQRFFKFNKDTYSKTIEITEIYDTPKESEKLENIKESIMPLTVSILAKSIVDSRNELQSEVIPINWLGTTDSIAKILGLATTDYCIANSYKNTIHNVVHKEPLFKDKTVTKEDIYKYFSLTNNQIRSTVIKCLKEIEHTHIGYVNYTHLIFDKETELFHQVNMNDPLDKERIEFYNDVCVEMLDNYGITDDKISTLVKNKINPSEYFREIYETTEFKGFSVFKGYSIYLMESGLNYYYKTHNLNNVDIDEYRLRVYNLFNNRRTINQQRYQKKHAKSTDADIGTTIIFDNEISENYTAVCDYLTKKYKEFENYIDIKHKIGFENCYLINAEEYSLAKMDCIQHITDMK